MTQAIGPAFSGTTHVENRVIPYALEAEQAVIGALLTDGRLWTEASAVLDARDFFRDAHRVLFEAMERLAESGTVIDYITVRDELVGRGQLDTAGGPAYVIGLTDGIPRSANVAAYAAVVKEKSRLRDIIHQANKVITTAYVADQSSSDIVESGVRSLLELAAPAGGDPVSISDAVTSYLRELDDPVAIGTITTGFKDLDEMLGGGLRTMDLTIVAARPSVGKSSLAIGIGTAAAKAGHSTVFFPVETGNRSVAERAVSHDARISIARMQQRLLSDADYGRISATACSMDGVPFLLHDAVSSVTQVAAWVHRLKQRPDGLTLVIIDYLQLLTHGDVRSREQEVSAISRALKRLAKQEEVAIVALSQLSRAPEQRQDKRPHLSDLRESGALEQDADVVLLIFRQDMYEDNDDTRGIAEVIVAKQRNGPTGTIRLAFMKDLAGKFDNLAPQS